MPVVVIEQEASLCLVLLAKRVRIYFSMSTRIVSLLIVLVLMQDSANCQCTTRNCYDENEPQVSRTNSWLQQQLNEQRETVQSMKDTIDKFKESVVRFEDIKAEYEDVKAKYEDNMAKNEDTLAKYEDSMEKYDESMYYDITRVIY